MADTMTIKIIVFAEPGNFSHSLLALLKTIPQVDLALFESCICHQTKPVQMDTDLVIIDRDIRKLDLIPMIKKLKLTFPNAKFMLLEDRLWYTHLQFSTEVDCVVAKSTSAGEFLMTIKQLTTRPTVLDNVKTISPSSMQGSFEPSIVI
jgi:hypothetical protein